MTTISTIQARSKGLHTLLWVVQVIVGGMFIMGGFMKTFVPIEELSVTMPWTKDTGLLLTRFIGVSELLGGLGLILPAALRIAPRLTVWAAYGLALVMVLALLFHIDRGEVSALPSNIVLGLLSFFVAWGRTMKAQIHPRE